MPFNIAVHRVGFPMAGEKYLSAGEKWQKVGRNGKNQGETSRCIYFTVQNITMCKPWYHQVHLYRDTIKLFMFSSV